MAHINQNGVIHEAGYPWGIHNTLEPLYRHPPQQRTWVGLNWSDLPDEWVGKPAFMEGAKWAESKLKEKNT